MKVLFTGMASSHAKPSANVTFFGLLAESVGELATVEWQTPSITWTKEFLDGYDAVFIGVVPPTSPSANKVYGAMHAINLMYDSPKLHLVVDHPQLWQFKSGLAAICRSVDSIFTSFYSGRREFKSAKDAVVTASILSAAQKLTTQAWPKTIYPDLPWKDFEFFSKFLGPVGSREYIGLNLDHRLMEDPRISAGRGYVWSVDNAKTGWSKKIVKLLSLPLEIMKDTPKDTDAQVEARISNSIGILLSPQERGVGTWWSYRHIQAMNTLTPVVSDWRETGVLDSSWDILASTVEELDDNSRLELSRAQRKSYINAIPDRLMSTELLNKILNSSKEGSYSDARS